MINTKYVVFLNNKKEQDEALKLAKSIKMQVLNIQSYYDGIAYLKYVGNNFWILTLRVPEERGFEVFKNIIDLNTFKKLVEEEKEAQELFDAYRKSDPFGNTHLFK
mgnify:CR=1 FL=1